MSSPPHGTHWLHPEEARRAASPTWAERRRVDFLTGRWAAKQALMSLAPDARPQTTWIDGGAFGQPVLRDCRLDLAVSISHAPGLTGALAYDVGFPSGVDIERLDVRSGSVAARHLLAGAGSDWEACGEPEHIVALRCWAAGEALGKALTVGLAVDAGLLRSTVEMTDGVAHHAFATFPQYRALSWLTSEHVLAVAAPRAMLDSADALVRMARTRTLDDGALGRGVVVRSR